MPALTNWLQEAQPDVALLQEIKSVDDGFPREHFEDMGYQAHIHGQKGHYGVAILTKKKPLKVIKGFIKDTEESQKRFISVEYKIGKKVVHVLNGYFPQGEERNHPTKFPAKQKFYKDLISHLKISCYRRFSHCYGRFKYITTRH